MIGSNFQKHFIALLEASIGKHEVLVNFIVDNLNCSRDSAYRRLNGKTEISLNEAVLLARNMGVSLNQLLGQHDRSVVFMRDKFITNLDEYEAYMENSLKQLEEIRRHPDHLLIYQAKDVPVYYQFAFPTLAAFKIYVWLKSVYNINKMEGDNYALKDIPSRLTELADLQWQAYSKINAIEIWNDTTILSLLNQLEYYFEAGLLSSKEEALQICDEFQKMMKQIYKQALEGYKVHAKNRQEFAGASYRMYYHEILLMDNHIMAQLDARRLRYFIPYAGVNYLSTEDPILTRDMHAYLKAQTKKSSLISDISEKERNKFFIRIKGRIDQLRHKIETVNPFM